MEHIAPKIDIQVYWNASNDYVPNPARAGSIGTPGYAQGMALAAAEAGIQGLREALAEARRPFWRRWLG